MDRPPALGRQLFRKRSVAPRNLRRGRQLLFEVGIELDAVHNRRRACIVIPKRKRVTDVLPSIQKFSLASNNTNGRLRGLTPLFR